MTIVAIVTRPADIDPLLGWGHRLATAHDMPLNIVILERGQPQEQLEVISWDNKDTRRTVEQARETGRILQPQPLLQYNHCDDYATLIPKIANDLGAKLLILNRLRDELKHARRWQDEVMGTGICDTLILRASPESAKTCARILLPVSPGPHSQIALKWLLPLAKSTDANLVAMNISSGFGEEAVAVGQRVINAVLKKAGLASEDKIESKVILSESVTNGIASEAKNGYDLVVIGASELGFVRRVLSGTVPERLLKGEDGVALGVMRGARPLSHAIKKAFANWVSQHVPQMQREERIDLFEKLEFGAKGDIDFFALTGFATFIASLGLIQNSGAVVIGAMLVAPLMVPMIGAGLGLVQGNVVLVRNSARSILLGFLMALIIGVTAGFVFKGYLPENAMTDQLNARGQITILDLFVALVSGIAAAYANARPNLSGALPGVAIAAALVPPIATSGIALANGHWTLSRNAVTLFGTNLICIVLGAACALWVLGIRGNPDQPKKRIWARRIFIILVLLALCLALYLNS